MTNTLQTASPAFELEIKRLIVDSLMLKDQKAEEIDENAPLFVQGLGLDSIDALELAMAIGKRYQVKFSPDDAVNKQTFANVRNLAAYVVQAMPAAASAPPSPAPEGAR